MKCELVGIISALIQEPKFNDDAIQIGQKFSMTCQVIPKTRRPLGFDPVEISFPVDSAKAKLFYKNHMGKKYKGAKKIRITVETIE